jgi:glycosyltransferase involved in cell wall biosynthesis/sulfatase maturation enzyme AslB (radical SAM superfamily)
VTSFSVIIPAYNAEASLASCLRSALTQDLDGGNFEVLLIDDCSTDMTHALALASVVDFPALRVTQTLANGGPGIARNLGIAQARGEWILFLDSDDALAPGALSRLTAFLALPEQTDCDAVSFDWHHADQPPDIGARRDQREAFLDKRDLIHRYLSLQMDGSVIYTAIRRTLLLEHGLVFAAGYHEDVDYLFKVYWQARRIGFLDAVLYAKRRRAGSIAETISTRHLDGFIRAWREIGEFLRSAPGEDFAAWRPSYLIGRLGLLATRVREICRRTDTPEAAAILYAALYLGWQSLDGSVNLGATPTQYSQIAHCFVTAMESDDSDAVARARRITGLVKEIMHKTWSCNDLHHSVFLAPDQVRTCCKRFFVDGEIRGDVVLLDTANAPDVTGAQISAAKRELHTAINRGDVTDCSGCPFLEFKEWGPIHPTRIRYLSFEYHSVCNLKCTYCSDTYYGGAKPRYDIQGLVDGFIAVGALDSAGTVVWGGGEPVVDERFTPLIDALVSRLPSLTQRVLTNSVTYSATIVRLLAADRIAITTSIDAGTRETFTQIRGSDRLDRVIRNLQKYANANPAKVTVKYIFTEGNQSLDECRAFVELMRGAGLLQCNFQISHDFKSETIDAAVLVSIIALYGALVAAGSQVVFFDDLLRQRLVGMDSDMEASVRRQLAALGLDDVLIEAAGPMDLAIWGAGWQAKYLLANASFFKHAKPAFLVDSTPSKIGSKFMGIAVRDPRELINSDIPVLIAAVQGYPAIYREFISLGLSPSRLITKLVI